MIRIARLGKLYRFLKIFRLLRITRLFQQQKKFANLMQMKSSVERLLVMFTTFVMASHILSCLWLFFAQLVSDDETKMYKDSWAEKYMNDEKTNSFSSMYCISLYWVITTLSTVGYGDISASSPIEQIFSIGMMVAGTVWFAYINGILFSLIQNID